MPTKNNVFIFDPINEKMVLSAMISDYGIRKRLCSELSTQDFYVEQNKIIFETLQTLDKKNAKYNEDTFIVECRHEQTKFGGIKTLRELEEMFVPNNENIDLHIKHLKEDSTRASVYSNEYYRLGQLLESKSSLFDIDQQLSKIREKIVDKMELSNIVSGEHVLLEYIKDLKSRSVNDFVATCLPELDKWLVEGLAKKKISVWAGFSGSGKTTLLANVIRRLALQNKYDMLICPLEVGMVSMMDAMVCIEANMYAEDLIKNFEILPKSQKIEVYNSAKNILRNRRISFTEKATFGFEDLRAILNKKRYDIIVIDLFEKLKEVRRDLDQKNISSWLDELQVMAQDYNVHFAITAQIKRGETRTTKGRAKKPMLESLKNSGKYVEVADLVIGLFRLKYFEPDSTDIDTIDISVLKQRRGDVNRTFKYEFIGPKLTVGNFVDDSSDDDDDIDHTDNPDAPKPPCVTSDEFDVYS